jgi:chorismate mutase
VTIARGIAKVKRQQGLSIRDRQREQEILDKVASSVEKEGLNPELVRRVFEAIIELSAEAENRP